MSRYGSRRLPRLLVGLAATAALGLSLSGAAAADGLWSWQDHFTGLAAPGCTDAEQVLRGTRPFWSSRPAHATDFQMAVEGVFATAGDCLEGTTIDVQLLEQNPGVALKVVNSSTFTIPAPGFGVRWSQKADGNWSPLPGGFLQVNTRTCYQGTCGPTHWTRLAVDTFAITRGSVPAQG